MGDKDPKNIEKLKEQAEDKKEEALEYRHETPAEKEEDHEREDAIQEAHDEGDYSDDSEPSEEQS